MSVPTGVLGWWLTYTVPNRGYQTDEIHALFDKAGLDPSLRPEREKPGNAARRLARLEHRYEVADGRRVLQARVRVGKDTRRPREHQWELWRELFDGDRRVEESPVGVVRYPKPNPRKPRVVFQALMGFDAKNRAFHLWPGEMESLLRIQAELERQFAENQDQADSSKLRGSIEKVLRQLYGVSPRPTSWFVHQSRGEQLERVADWLADLGLAPERVALADESVTQVTVARWVETELIKDFGKVSREMGRLRRGRKHGVSQQAYDTQYGLWIEAQRAAVAYTEWLPCADFDALGDAMSVAYEDLQAGRP